MPAEITVSYLFEAGAWALQGFSSLLLALFVLWVARVLVGWAFDWFDGSGRDGLDV